LSALSDLKDYALTIKANPALLAVIRAALAGRNLKRKDFAEAYNISPQYFSAMLKGKERWREEILDRMLADLNLTDLARRTGLR
jgi:transcriptional regulator with XRE-family HTH domain